MIDKKKIEEAAEKYAKKKEKLCEKLAEKYKSANSLCSIVSINPDAAFKDGINWFKDNLWHDASEEPKKDKVLLIKYHQLGVRDPRYLVLNDIANTAWSDTVEDYHIYSWLNIEDLMKGGK